ncbi:DENN domain-containing protein 5B [Phytophthora cinnamomi]|uniref:DENN domain-containing protein 5B n=1 Tax=Phytophthora cinnamomi TaxID=4785 RepID=UPI00355A2281|nr:DENN domain-containing protein 5B [Phytophthora cinnamomi]
MPMRSIANVSLDSWLFGEDKAAADAAPSRGSVVGLAFPQPRRQSVRLTGKTSPLRSAPELSHPFPASSKLRKLFRPNKLPQWKRGGGKGAQHDKQRQLVGLDTTSFQKLQGHVPFTLKEIVKDPKKLPYLLQWLSVDTEIPSDATHSNYHQVLLFLMEIEQLQTVDEDKRREQALKIWHKYIDNASEFQIATTLELTRELEQLVKGNIDSSSKVVDSFFPIQKLAYMRLTREEMPRFLKSDEYLKMLIDTEDGTRTIPMDRILQQPRAAHYFLLFLMQSRQHFELYFWLHVEYVLKPVLEEANYELFWRLARVLVDKAQNDSQAITLATKNDLYLAIASRRFDEKLQPPQPVAKALFNKAQQEIFAMLRSSWFDRFTKSDLYKVALQDSMIHFDLVESKEDSPPKLLSRAFSSAEYSRVQAVDGDSASSGGEGEEDKDEERDEEERADSKGTTDNSDRMSANNSEQGSEIDSAEESEDREFAKVVLNLESIIRLTKLPEGLQVHYRPNYESPTANAPAPKDDDCGIDTILTFATFLEKQEDEDAAATLMLMPVPNPHKDKDSTDESFDDISRRIKTFLVPSGRILIKRSGGEKCPADMLFPFQQSGRNGFLFGSVYLTYEPVHVGTSNEEHYVAKGFCLLSHLPLVNSLRKLVEEHVQSSQEQSSIFAHDRLALLFQSSISWTRTTITSARTHTYVHPEMRRLAHRKHSSILSLPLSTLETQVDVPMTILFEQFGTAMVLQILASAVLECSIVVVASQYSLLTMCAEAIRNLLRPFSWCHVYAPVLPKPLLSYLQCPTPILVGVNSEFALRSDLPTRGFYLVADVDRKVVEYVGDQSVAWRGMGLRDDLGEDAIFLPRCFEAAKQELDRLLFPRALQYDSIGGCDTFPVDTGDTSLTYASPPETEAERDEQVRGICFDLFSELLSGHTNACLVVGDTKESVVIFDETEFLATRADEDSQFYQALLRTQCFSEIVSAHRINMSSKESDADAEALDADEDLQEGII